MTDRDEGRTADFYRSRLEVVAKWLATNKPEVFSEGLWDVLDSHEAEPSGDVGEEEFPAAMAFLDRLCDEVGPYSDLYHEGQKRIRHLIRLARLRRTPETEAKTATYSEALKRLRYVESPLWDEDGSCHYCGVGFYKLGREHDDGCPVGAILTMYPRTRWDEVRDDAVATHDPNAGGSDE